MGTDQLAHNIVMLLGQRLGEAARGGRGLDAGTGELLRQVADRLARTPAGQWQLAALHNYPDDLRQQRDTAAVLAQSAAGDDALRAAFQTAVGGNRPVVHSATPAFGNARPRTTRGGGNRIAVAVLAVVALIGVFLVVRGITGGTDSDAYQEQVAATCTRFNAILDEKHNKAFIFPADLDSRNLRDVS